MKTLATSWFKVVVMACLFASLCGQALAQPGSQELSADQRTRLDDILIDSQALYGTIGYSVVLLAGAEVIYENHGGVVDQVSGAAPDGSSVYPVYSASKLLFNVALLQAVERQEIALDATLGTLVTDLPESWKQVSLATAISHASGFPEYFSRPFEPTARSALERVFDEPFLFERGTGSRYTQTNYALGRLALERASGQPYETLLAQGQAAVAGMSDLEIFREGAHIDNAVTSYQSEAEGGGSRGMLYWMPYHFSGTGLNLSLDDFTLWAQALVRGRFVPRETLLEHWQGFALADGGLSRFSHGWEFEQHGEFTGVGHGGGGRVVFRHYFDADAPDTSVTVVYLDNGGTRYFSQSRLALRLASVVMPELSEGAE